MSTGSPAREGDPSPADTSPPAADALPGTQPPRRFVPRFHWELLVCGIRGHELVGTDAATLRGEDRLVAFERDGVRWHRCLRCDSWLPLRPPDHAGRQTPPDRDAIALPLRGKPLRDRIVVRLIAIDRALHFLILALLGIAVLLLASHRTELRHTFYRVVSDLQMGVGGGPVQTHRTGILHDLDHWLSLSDAALHRFAVVVLVYAAVEGLEAVGLWFERRWAEYLTFIVTASFLPFEVWELTSRVSALKIVALVLNIAVVIYLLVAKRLFGLRGGGRGLERERERDVGWPALERSSPVT